MASSDGCKSVYGCGHGGYVVLCGDCSEKAAVWQRPQAWRCGRHLTIERPTSTRPRYHAHQLMPRNPAAVSSAATVGRRKCGEGAATLRRRPPRRRFTSPTSRDRPMHMLPRREPEQARNERASRMREQQHAAPWSLATVARVKSGARKRTKRQKAAESGRKRQKADHPRKQMMARSDLPRNVRVGGVRVNKSCPMHNRLVFSDVCWCSRRTARYPRSAAFCRLG